MTDQEYRHLLWHTGDFYDEAYEQLQAGPPLAAVLWQMRKGESVPIEPAFQEVMHELHAINHKINGEIPSTIGMNSSVKQAAIPRVLLFAIAGLSAQFAETVIVTRSEYVQRLAWRFSFAWTLVLGGDIDDLLRDVATDEHARFC
jgi:hypothetical protein